MNPCIHVLRNSLLSLALLGTISGPTSAAAQSVSSEETVRSVRRLLERLPYYGVFDYIVFRVDRGTVYLAGYSSRRGGLSACSCIYYLHVQTRSSSCSRSAD